jgi:hypothetical protein
MVNDGLISALSGMENAVGLPRGRPSDGRTRNVRQALSRRRRLPRRFHE